MNNVVDVSKIWDFFTHYEDKLITQHMLVAANPSENTEIYLTSEMGCPLFTVEIGSNIETSEASDDKITTEDLYDSLLHTYIYDDTDYGIYSEEEYERRDEISCAAWDLISVLCQENPEVFGIEDNEIEEIVLDLEKSLCNKFGIRTEHPLAMELDGGEYFVTLYPCMLFEDEEDISPYEDDDEYNNDFCQSDYDIYADLIGDDFCV